MSDPATPRTAQPRRSWVRIDREGARTGRRSCSTSERFLQRFAFSRISATIYSVASRSAALRQCCARTWGQRGSEHSGV